MEKETPIGIFDSGYGGLTVFRSILKYLPEYDYLYFGDNARTPYGTRSFETVYQYTRECVNYLFSKGCELIVLACNTASAKALRKIQQEDLPQISANKRVLGVIRPTAEVIGHYSKSGEIGVVATPGTVESQSYLMEIAHFFPQLKVLQQACPIWVPLVENGEWDNEGGDFFIRKYLDQLFLQSRNIDTVLLGCTHYPVMESRIKAHLPKDCTLVSQGEIVAKSLVNYLSRHPEIEQICTRNGQRTYLTTGSSPDFDRQSSLFLGETISSGQVIL